MDKDNRTGLFARFRAMTTTKKLLWICLVNGFAWVWCSYILAWLDRAQTAESLSQVAVTEIIGVTLAYCVKALAENIHKYGKGQDGDTPEDAFVHSVTGAFDQIMHDIREEDCNGAPR